MSIRFRLALPVMGLVAVAILCLAAWPLAFEALVLLSLAGVIATGMVLGQAIRMAEQIGAMPGAMRDRIWDAVEAPLPGAGQNDEFGQFSDEMRDIADAMRDVIEQGVELTHLAHSDPLTDLPNRRALERLLAKVADDHATGRRPGGIGLLHLDLDYFKAVNDRLGHDAGDYALGEAARIMSASIRDSDFLARIGGDEFVIVAPGVDNDQVLVRIADRIIDAMGQALDHGGHSFRLGVSIGIVLGGLRGKLLDPTRLLMNADIALCHAKVNGRNQHAIFSSSMARIARRRENQADEIRKGLDHDAFRPLYQPVIDLVDGRARAIHVHSSWEAGAYNTLSPDDLLMTAEAHSLIEELGMRVFEHACQALADWHRQGGDVPRLQILLNHAQLLGLGVTDRISWALDSQNLQPEQIALLVAEPHCAGRNSELIMANLDRCRALGFPIVLDEFGAESGALANIARLMPAGLIVANRLTADLPDAKHASTDRMMLETLVGGAERMGIPITAKQVDEPTQIETLRRMGIDFAIGCAFAPSMDAERLGSWLTAQADQTDDLSRQTG